MADCAVSSHVQFDLEQEGARRDFVHTLTQPYKIFTGRPFQS